MTNHDLAIHPLEQIILFMVASITIVTILVVVPSIIKLFRRGE